MRRTLALSFMLALLVAAPVAAQPYRWVDENGTVHYGDRPPQPAPPTLENLNPNARQRRPDPSPAKTAPAQPAPPQPATPQPASEPTPAVAPSPEVPTAPSRRVPQPKIEARPAPTPPPPTQSEPAPPEPTPAVGAGREDGRGLVREVMELAGIDRYLEDLARSAQGDLARLAWSTREPSAAWAALAPVFRRDVLAAATAAALARRLETEHLPALLAWLHSPEHRQLRQAELDSAKPANHRSYRQFVAGLADPNAKLPHLSLVQQLERSGRGADRHLALERALRQSMRRAVAPLAVRAPDDDEEETSPRAEERTRFWLMTGTLFAYRGLGSAQIEAAVRFERSPAGVWFTTAAWESLEEAVRVVEQRATAAIRSVATRSLSPR
jgi:hypothetical protein